jgi:hypothetical protein
MTEESIPAEKVIEAFGGNAKVAKLCDITPGAVSQWKHNGIPKAQLNYLKAKRPKLFATLLPAKVAPQ